MPRPGFVPLRVVEVVTETVDASSFVLGVPERERAAFSYRAGQYCTFKVTTESGEHLRCYSMSSSPDVDEPMRTTVKRVPGGAVSNWLIDRVTPGDELLASPPAGTFCLEPDDDRPVVAFAGGSGITPVISIAKSALATTPRPVRLFVADRDAEAAILSGELDHLAAGHGPRVSLTRHHDHVSGLVDPDEVAEFVGRELDVSVYLCGPAPFMDLVEDTLLTLGHDPALLRTERFVLPDPVVEPPVSARSGSITLSLAGTVQRIDHHADETILEAARRAGLQPPFSCQAGNCATCLAELSEGGVDMRTNDVLTPDEVAQGLILTCQAVPTTVEVTVAYPD